MVHVLIMSLSKCVYCLYSSSQYRLIALVYAGMGIYLCVGQRYIYDLAIGVLMMVVSMLYFWSIKSKSYITMWFVIFLQLALASCAV